VNGLTRVCGSSFRKVQQPVEAMVSVDVRSVLKLVMHEVQLLSENWQRVLSGLHVMGSSNAQEFLPTRHIHRRWDTIPVEDLWRVMAPLSAIRGSSGFIFISISKLSIVIRHHTFSRA